MADVPTAVVAPAPAPSIPCTDHQTLTRLVRCWKICQMLEWIGFSDAAQRAPIIDNAFSSYSDILALEEKDI